MRDLLSKPKTVVRSGVDGSVQIDGAKRKILSYVNDDTCGALLDISFQRMLKKEKVLPEVAFSLGPLELWSDDFEGKGDFGQYRSKLVCNLLNAFFLLHHTFIFRSQ